MTSSFSRPLFVSRLALRFLLILAAATAAGIAEAESPRELLGFLLGFFPLAAVGALAGGWQAGGGTRASLRPGRLLAGLGLGFLLGLLWAAARVAARGIGGGLSGAGGLAIGVAVPVMALGTAFFVEAERARSRFSRYLAFGLTLVAAWAVPRALQPAARALSSDRELTVVSFQLVPGPAAVRPDLAGAADVTPGEISLLRATGVTGTLRFRARSVLGEGKAKRVVLVFTGPLRERTDLSEPRGGSALYLQDGPTWRELAGDGGAPSRAIGLSPRDADRAPASRSVEIWMDDGGIRTGAVVELER